MPIRTDSRRTGLRAVVGLLSGLMLPCVLTLGGCASTVGSDLTVFHAWPASDSPRTYRFLRSPEQRDSLAAASYERILAAELARPGFRPSAEPRYEIGYRYETERKTDRWIEPRPYFWPYFWFGGGHPGAHIGFGGSFGWSPYAAPVERSREYFERRLQVEIRDLSVTPARKVYESRAVNGGLSEQSIEVLPFLARALFSDFPGTSGRTWRVEVPAP